MEAKYSSETLVDFQLTTERYIPEDSTLHNHRSENLKPYLLIGYLLSSLTAQFSVTDKETINTRVDIY
jgi:hypothetical protein